MATNINTILQWFITGTRPTQDQFQNSWRSFWHKDESIPQANIENLESDLNLKANQEDFSNHLTDPSAHIEIMKALEQESYIVIDTLVSGSVYKVSENDFGKTLRYNGTSPVTILLSTAMPSATGNRFKIYQAGPGQVTFSVNGYILRYGSDALPKLYGTYSTAVVEVTDSSPAVAYIYGKLELA